MNKSLEKDGACYTSRILVITGPTGVGKTDIALKIARQIPSEIINGDVGQLYVPLTIGTAKPDLKNQAAPHHLFDVMAQPIHMTTFEYRARVLHLISEIQARGRLPIIVGGSLFYIRSLFFPQNKVRSSVSKESTNLEQEHVLQNNASQDDTWDMLYGIDPVRAASIHPHDQYRIHRALSLWRQTGLLPSTFQPTYQPPCLFDLLVLTRDRDDLYDRINRRVLVMFEQGLLDEVASLLDTPWESFLKKKKIIGYPEVLEYLRGDRSSYAHTTMVAFVQQRTRWYAKQQMTFLKKLERELQEAFMKNADLADGNAPSVCRSNLTSTAHDLYIKQLLSAYELRKKDIV